jgi:hypothetical protein
LANDTAALTQNQTNSGANSGFVDAWDKNLYFVLKNGLEVLRLASFQIAVNFTLFYQNNG